MENAQALKAIVREKYADIAGQPKATNAASCCGSGPVSNKIYNIMMDDYSGLEGYNADADLGLGCGLPTAFAGIAAGDMVIDLGSGAGNDCFVARHETGATGKVIGIDFTPEMIAKARENADRMGYNNVEFREGDIDNMPVAADVADVVVSNCVLNLVPDKPAVFAEMFRVLKPGGHFSVSDIVLVGELPEALRGEAELYAGCVSGAIQKSDYLALLAAAGFEAIEIRSEKTIMLPDDILEKYLSPDQIQAFALRRTGIFSITVNGVKPGGTPRQLDTPASSGCTPGSGCC